MRVSGIVALIFVVAAAGAAPAQSVKHASSAPRAPRDQSMVPVDWFSLAPPPTAYQRAGTHMDVAVHDVDDGENLTVYGKRFARLHKDALPGSDLFEPSHLEAAQPIVPRMGEGCSYKSGCFDSGQPSLLSSANQLIGGQ